MPILLLLIAYLFFLASNISNNTFFSLSVINGSIYYLILFSCLFYKRFYLSIGYVTMLKFFVTVFGVTVFIPLTMYLFNGLESGLIIIKWFFAIDHLGNVRPLGIASEPSYMVFFVSFAILALYRISKIDAYPPPRVLSYIAILILMLSGSIYAYLILCICSVCLIYYLPTRNRLVASFCICIFVIFAIYTTDILKYDRFYLILHHILNNENLAGVDTSTYLRLAPFLDSISQLDFLDTKTYMGHGSKYSAYKFAENYSANLPDGKNVLDAGFASAYLVDYGLISYVAIILFVIVITKGYLSYFSRILFLLLSLNANFSTTLFCFALSCLILTSKSNCLYAKS